MENYSVSSYPDSHESSPRSREIDSWDELPANTKVRFMCSYGGKIHPRPHDNQLAYVGGDTKILAVDRAIRLSDLLSKLSALCGGSEVCFKYQLPGEDLDALISVTNDEDLEHMMLEYDRLYRVLAKPARLRLFLFHVAPATAAPKSDGQWFVDALNSVPLQSLETASPPSAVANPDFLFGFDKGPPPDPPQKLLDRTPPKEVPVGLEYSVTREDPAVLPAEIDELRRLQISTQEQQQARAYQGEYYTQKLPENLQPPAPGAYWQDTRHVTTTGYPMAPAGNVGADQPVYIIQGPGGAYLQAAIRPMMGQVGQAYYGVPPSQGVVPAGAYRQHPVYNASVAVAPVQHPERHGQGMDGGYGHVPYDGSGSGRQVYYTAPGGVLQPYQAAAAAVDGRQAGVLSQEGKVMVMGKAAPQASV